jgi:diaminopimelate decarboxylase
LLTDGYKINHLGHLTFDNVDLVEMVQTYGTPQYVFSENRIIKNYSHIKASFETTYKGNVKIAYSVKTNPTLMIMKVLSKRGAMFEVSSLGEMYRAKKVGIDMKRLVFTNIYKSEDSIRYALEENVGFIAIDSLCDLKQVNKIAKEFGKEIPILIRANPCIELKDVIFASGAPWSKTGVPIIEDEKVFHMIDNVDTAENLFKTSFNMTHVNPVGVHGHLGSQINDVNFYDAFSKILVSFFIKMEEKFKVKLDYLDFGGGYPIPYFPDERIPSIKQIAKTITLNVNSAGISPTLILESGRFIIGSAGVLLTKVGAVKNDPLTGKTVVVDACAYNELLDSVLVHWYFEIEVVDEVNRTKREYVRVVGSTNDSLDAYDPLTDKKCLKCGEPISKSRKRLLPPLKRGNILAIKNAGAYSVSFNMNYCTHLKPPIFLITKNGRIAIIRRKETLEDVLRLEVS